MMEIADESRKRKETTRNSHDIEKLLVIDN
jgi:hypothetical protein